MLFGLALVFALVASAATASAAWIVRANEIGRFAFRQLFLHARKVREGFPLAAGLAELHDCRRFLPHPVPLIVREHRQRLRRLDLSGPDDSPSGSNGS